MVYLDNAATTKPYKEVVELFLENVDEFGNPSSLHDYGFRAKQKLEEARETIAQLVNCEPDEVIFTSGGSEANTQAIMSAMRGPYDHAVCSAFEHDSVNDALTGRNVTFVNPDSLGYIRVEDMEKAITNNTTLVACMAINNELGVIQDVEEMGYMAHSHGKIFFSDGVQLFPHFKCDFKNSGIDMISASSHKFFGFKGQGFLICSNKITPYKLIKGGMQERGHRGGTENVLGAITTAKALEVTIKQKKNNYYNSIFDLESIIHNQFYDEDKDVRFNGDYLATVPGFINMSFKNLRGDEIQSMMNERGFAISTGSACHSGSAVPSRTLMAIGCPEEYINGTIRISMSVDNTEEEIKDFVKNLKEVVEILRKY